MKKTILSLAVLICISACASNKVHVNGKTYLKNENGELVLTKHDIKTLRKDPNVVIVDKVMPDHAVTVSSEELALISQDSDLFEEKVTGVINQDVFVFALKTGSLKENLQRLSDKFSSPDSKIDLNYSGVDYYIDEPKVIRSSSIEILVAEILSGFPVVTAIDTVE